MEKTFHLILTLMNNRMSSSSDTESLFVPYFVATMTFNGLGEAGSTFPFNSSMALAASEAFVYLTNAIPVTASLSSRFFTCYHVMEDDDTMTIARHHDNSSEAP